MKIHSLIFALPLMLCVACGRDEHPVSPVLASRSADSIKTEWNRPHEAVLRIHLDSERPMDQLTNVTIQGSCLSVPVSSWQDMLLTHPFERDYVIQPTVGQSDILVTAVISGMEYSARTIVPHLQEGTRTQLNLTLESGRLRIISSWIEEAPEGAQPWLATADTVRVGYYLLKDGRLVSQREADAVAYVIETDGVHGKAVALEDAEGTRVFSTAGISSGTWYATLDGDIQEGYLIPGHAEADSAHLVKYRPGRRMPGYCALSIVGGYECCDSLLAVQPICSKDDMLGLMTLEKGAYIPSISELTNYFYFQRRGYDRYGCDPSGLRQMSGAYLSSTESSAETAYSIDFTRGTVTGITSKRFTPMKVRLFYIF